MILTKDFYKRGNVALIGRQLLGKYLVTCLDGIVTSGMIVETEAYSWKERGCHAYMNKVTKRNAVMFENGGVCYVYLCYGIHHLFNVVTNRAGLGEAVLIRALQPSDGLEAMKKRMKTSSMLKITSGPGKLTKAMGITTRNNGFDLMGPLLKIEDRQEKINKNNIVATTRIGIDYAGEDAMLPWRFFLKGNKWVSK